MRLSKESIKARFEGKSMEEKITLLTVALQSCSPDEEEILIGLYIELIGELGSEKKLQMAIDLAEKLKEVLPAESENRASLLQNYLYQISMDIPWDGNDEEKTAIFSHTSRIQKQHDTLFPINLVADFDEFINYISGNTVQLTKTKEYIARKHLLKIDERMTVRAEGATARTDQDYYPYIHFFHTLALSGRLLEKVAAELKETERMKLYRDLTDIEKYFFLLETFWVDVNWGNLQDRQSQSIPSQLTNVFSILLHESPGQRFNLKNPLTEVGQSLKGAMYDWNYFQLYFEWLGFWICEEDVERKEQRGTKSSYYAKSITLTDFGSNMIPVLLFSRNIQAWNRALRRENGDFNAIPGTELEDLCDGNLSDEDFGRLLINVKQDQSTQSFFQPFADLFPSAELRHTLPRNRKKFLAGRYLFKVSLSKGTWRKLVLSAKHTMEDLHQAIINAFQFDNEYLYSFFMDGRMWSHDCIASPDDDFGHADASKVQIGMVGLLEKQQFLYVYDYGDEWTFVVEVDEIEGDIQELFNPYVEDAKGNAPKQYGDYY